MLTQRQRRLLRLGGEIDHYHHLRHGGANDPDFFLNHPTHTDAPSSVPSAAYP